MTGDPLSTVETLNGVGGDAHVHLFFDERVGHGVVVAVHLDVIVDMDSCLFPLGVFVRFGTGRGPQGRFIQLLKQGAPGAWQFLEGPVVERLEQRPDGAVQLGQGEALTPAARAARIQRSTTCTATSAFALSRGTAHPAPGVSKYVKSLLIRKLKSPLNPSTEVACMFSLRTGGHPCSSEETI